MTRWMNFDQQEDQEHVEPIETARWFLSNKVHGVTFCKTVNLVYQNSYESLTSTVLNSVHTSNVLNKEYTKYTELDNKIISIPYVS
jgi:hypothetical protein